MGPTTENNFKEAQISLGHGHFWSKSNIDSLTAERYSQHNCNAITTRFNNCNFYNPYFFSNFAPAKRKSKSIRFI